MEIMWRVISWEGAGGEWGKGTGIQKYNWIGTKQTGGQGDIKSSVGNGEVK